jgi:hypothetical protein
MKSAAGSLGRIAGATYPAGKGGGGGGGGAAALACCKGAALFNSAGAMLSFGSSAGAALHPNTVHPPFSSKHSA